MPAQALPMDPPLGDADLDRLLHRHTAGRPRLDRLWRYYRNPATAPATAAAATAREGRPRLAQEEGLPGRLTSPAARAAGRERVVENDIGWRVHTLVDFAFGSGPTVRSLAEDDTLAGEIDSLLRGVFDEHGGAGFFHDLALLGCVYGHVDVLLRVDWDALQRAAIQRAGPSPAPVKRPRPAPAPVPDGTDADEDLHAVRVWGRARGRVGSLASRYFALDLIDAPRAAAVVSADDYRRLDAFAIHDRRAVEGERSSLLDRVRSRVLGGDVPEGGSVERTEVYSAQSRAVYAGTPSAGGGVERSVVEVEVNRLGRVPVVHIQNAAQPFHWEGLSDVEPLIPLQDELNTRLSDRAHRVTFQSFKMYLGVNVEGFAERPVGPGQMWATDHPAARIEQFGGDAASPSEDAHIAELRDALDKASGVTPVAAGLIRDKVGNLTSENALRVTLMGLLAKARRKRAIYGRGIEQVCELVLHAADVAGVLATEPGERRVRLDWPEPLPENEGEQLERARLKLELGVPRRRVLAELGYADVDCEE